MHIQKAIFSVSSQKIYNSYWNIASKLYREGLGIEPICLLFGKKSDTDMTEEYGKIIEMELDPTLPWVPQMTMSKFFYPTTEPETTWIIGDIDLLPLSKAHFTTEIAGVPDNEYVHLNASGISCPRVGHCDGFLKGSERHGQMGGFIGSDLPAHYHVAKGQQFKDIFFRDRNFIETVRYIVESDLYGMGITCKFPKENKEMGHEQQFWYYWLAEENYTSENLYNALKAKAVKYNAFHYDNENSRVWRWKPEANDYIYDHEKLHYKCMVDIHCSKAAPYESQSEAINRIVDISGILK